MFKLISLKLDKHPELGKVDLNFVDGNEINNSEKIYTSIVIGANGTGKSYILRTIAEIFRQFNLWKLNREKDPYLAFNIQIRYLLDGNIYEILDQRWQGYDKKGRVERGYIFLKNRPEGKEIFDSENKFEFTTKTGHEIEIGELLLPNKLIVSSIMLNDRFVFSDSLPDDFYQYLGVRRTSGIASTRSFQRKTIKYLFDATRTEKFKINLSNLLEFLGFEKHFKIHYKTRYNSLFLTENLNTGEFYKFYENWWNSNYTRRKQENPLWGKSHYDKLKSTKPQRIGEIIEYLSSLRGNSSRIINWDSRSKVFELDFFGESLKENEYELIEDLEKLDIINLIGLKLKKKGSELSLAEASSGEYHLILSLLGLFSKIEPSSLVLIDEPEISLHPNWQMRYIDFLKRMFKDYADCHFIIASHSHFLISDLEGKNSSVVALTRNTETNALTANLLDGIDTYGWSAEDVLYKIFSLRTTRNHYMEVDMRELLHSISEKKQNKADLETIINRLENVKLNSEDPLNLILTKAKEYIQKL